MIDLQKRIAGITSTLEAEIAAANRDYVNEKITPAAKKEAIKASVDTANFRINAAINDLVSESLSEAVKDRLISNVPKVKQIFNERMF